MFVLKLASYQCIPLLLLLCDCSQFKFCVLSLLSRDTHAVPLDTSHNYNSYHTFSTSETHATMWPAVVMS